MVPLSAGRPLVKPYFQVFNKNSYEIGRANSESQAPDIVKYRPLVFGVCSSSPYNMTDIESIWRASRAQGFVNQGLDSQYKIKAPPVRSLPKKTWFSRGSSQEPRSKPGMAADCVTVPTTGIITKPRR